MNSSAAKIIMAIVFILIGGFFISGGWEAYKDFARTKHYTDLTPGQLIKKHSARGSDGNTIYYVDYSFRPAGGDEINATAEMLKQPWDFLKEGDRLEIRYNPADPKQNFPTESGGASLIYAVFISILGAVFFLFGISSFLRSFRKRSTLK